MEQYDYTKCPVCGETLTAQYGRGWPNDQWIYVRYMHTDCSDANYHVFSCSLDVSRSPVRLSAWEVRLMLDDKVICVNGGFDNKGGSGTMIRDPVNNEKIAEIDESIYDCLNDLERLRNKLRTIITFQ
jgi:hypothetical protein